MTSPDDVLNKDDVAKDRNILFQEFKKALDDELQPHLQYVIEGFRRAHKLARAAVSYMRPEDTDDAEKLAERQQAADDILRAVVVLSHAYLEDFLRTLGKTFLPLSDEATLNEVPLIGTSETKRAEKFSLGKLAKQKGKLVDDVIRESVEANLARMSFNSATEIMSFLSYIGLKVDEDARKHLPAIDAMIRRRHLIVHNADRIEGKIQSINHIEALDWSKTAQEFMQALFPPLLLKKFTPEILAERFNIKVTKR